MGCSCSCNSGTKLLYACSGSANVGECADLVFRKLKKDKIAYGSCLAAIGANIGGYVQSAAGSDLNIVVDGCSTGCGRVIFEKLGLPFRHYVVTDYGVVKGKTEITGDIIDGIANHIAKEIKE